MTKKYTEIQINFKDISYIQWDNKELNCIFVFYDKYVTSKQCIDCIFMFELLVGLNANITFWLTHVFINKIEKPVNNIYKSGHCRIYEFDNDIEQKLS